MGSWPFPQVLLAAQQSIKAVPVAGLGDPILPLDPAMFVGYDVVRHKCQQLVQWFAAQAGGGAGSATSNRQQLIHNVSSSSGILLYGPSGCGKSYLTRALAGGTDCTWVSLKGSSVLSKYVGEAERVLRTTFRCAAAIAPCVLVIDEIDALTRSRRLAAEEDGGTSRQVLWGCWGGRGWTGPMVVSLGWSQTCKGTGGSVLRGMRAVSQDHLRA